MKIKIEIEVPKFCRKDTLKIDRRGIFCRYWSVGKCYIFNKVLNCYISKKKVVTAYPCKQCKDSREEK